MSRSGVEPVSSDAPSKQSRTGIVARRGKGARNIAEVAAARRMIEVVYYVLRDGEARCLTTAAAV